MYVDSSAILNKIPKLVADGSDRYSAIIVRGRPGIGKTDLAQSILPFVPRERFVRIPMASRTYEEFGSFNYPMEVEAEEYKHVNGQRVMDENGNPVKEVRKTIRVEQALSEVSIEPLLERNIGDDYGILLFDDVTLGDGRLQNALLEIVQFGVIAGQRIGRNVVIFLTGNNTDDGAYAIEWSAPLLGRSVVIDHEPDFNHWLTRPENQDICPTTVGFLKDFPKFFAPESGDKDTTDESGRSCAPRDWTRVGRGMFQQGGYRNFEPDFIFRTAGTYAKSMVGNKAGAAYESYARSFEIYPTAEELMADRSCWDKVPTEKRHLLGGTIGVLFGLRNFAMTKIKANLGKDAVINELLDTFFDRVLLVAEDNMELMGFVIDYLTNWAGDKNIPKEEQKQRQQVLAMAGKLIIADKYKNNKEFVNLLNAMFKTKVRK